MYIYLIIPSIRQQLGIPYNKYTVWNSLRRDIWSASTIFHQP